MFKREELVIDLEQRHIRGGKYIKVKLAKFLTKKMRGNWVIVNVMGK